MSEGGSESRDSPEEPPMDPILETPEPEAADVNPTDPEQPTPSKKSGGFSWEDYLTEFDFEAAPPQCFNQAAKPPVNRFEKGKLLAVPDLKGGGMLCLGSIQAVHATWINIRLEGTDHSDDRWVMCDDQDIEPIRRAGRDRVVLNPPVGYLHSLRGFHKWLEGMISGAEEAEDRLAPPEWFTPIDLNIKPVKNQFQVGYKLEAVDTKNFSGSPHVATIVKVAGNFVSVHFDGWSSSYDIEELHESRNLFPVGWSSLVGLDVAAPSMQALRAHASSIPRLGVSPGPSSAKASPATGRKVQRLSDVGAKPMTATNAARKAKLTGTRAVANSEKRGQGRKRQSDIRNEEAVQSKRPTSSSSGGTPNRAEERVASPPSPPPSPLLSLPPGRRPPQPAVPTLIPLRAMNAGQMANAPGSLLVLTGGRSPGAPAAAPMPLQQIQPVNGSFDGGTAPLTGQRQAHTIPPQPTGLRQPVAQAGASFQQGVPTDVMLSCGDSVPMSQRSMTVYMNPHCNPGALLNTEKLKQLPSVLGPLSIHHVVREVVQQLINCGNDHVQIYRKVDAGPVKILSVTAQVNGFTNVRYIPIVKNVSTAWQYLRRFLLKLGCCQNLVADSPNPCNLCPSHSDEAEEGVVSTSGPAGSSRSRTHLDGASEASGETSRSALGLQPAAQWTVERVCEELSRHADPGTVELFRAQQIDGHSLLLLKTEVLKDHMQLPLGPILKIMSFVESLKATPRLAKGDAQ